MEENHSCSQQKEIAALMTNMQLIVKEFYGNGKEGLVKIIPRIEEHIKALQQSTAAQSTLISGLTKLVTEINTIDNYKVKQDDMTWKKAGIIISSIIGFCAVLSSIIIKML